MIKFKHGNILNDNSEALINTVNCVGVMGRDIALQFKNTFPENFKAYVSACIRNEIQPGHMFTFQTGKSTNPRYIINFPTKRHWREKSRIEDIESGLQALVETIYKYNIKSVAIPALGSGLGKLDWSIVKSHIVNELQNLSEVQITIYEPIEKIH